MNSLNNLFIENQSKHKFFDALIELLDEKSFDEINVKELCERAGVSRMAFYRNFEAMENVLDGYFIEMGRLVFEEEKLDDSVNSINLGLIKIANKNRKFSNIYFNNSRRSMLEKLFKEQIQQYIEDHDYYIKVEERNFVASYCAGGIFSVISDWVHNDYKDDEEVILQVLNKLHYTNRIDE